MIRSCFRGEYGSSSIVVIVMVSSKMTKYEREERDHRIEQNYEWTNRAKLFAAGE